MDRESYVPKELQDGIMEALGSKVKTTFAQMVQLESKSDKLALLVLSNYRLFILSGKSPRKVDINIPLVDISSVESKTPQKLVISTESKKISLSMSTDNNVDVILCHLFLSFYNIFPDVSIKKLISKIEISPSTRLQEICDRQASLASKDTGQCGNYSTMYRCMCDYRGVEVMEDITWDVDNIYVSQGSKEFCLNDFDHIDFKSFIPILMALEQNAWFTKLTVTDVKLSPEILKEIRKVLKNNSTLKEFVLVNAGIRPEFVQKMLKSLLANSLAVVTLLNLSGNAIEDKGVKSFCEFLSSYPHGMEELRFAGTSMTARSINRLAFTFTKKESHAQTLRVLDLSENSIKGDDISNLLEFLKKPNVLEFLRLASMECSLDSLISSLNPGCCQRLVHLDVSGNFFQKYRKDTTCPVAWKEFFSFALSLKSINFSNCHLPSDAVKNVLLGIASNVTLRDLDVNLSANALGSEGAEVLEVCAPTVTNISSLDISDNSFDASLANILTRLTQNKSLHKLSIGRNFTNIKPKHIVQVMESVVQLIQEENSPISFLSVDNLRLKSDTVLLLNALGTNKSLKHLDISGNQMGDSGARMLSKALLINKKLTTIYLDHNNITTAGFHDIANALEKNYTVRKISMPLNDAASAHRLNPEKTESILRQIDSLLERNQKPRKMAIDQDFKLQQGLLVSSHQFMDGILSKLEESRRKLEELQKKSDSHLSNDETKSLVMKTDALTRDANASRQLLLEFQKVISKSEKEGLLTGRLKELSIEIHETFTKQLKINFAEMADCAVTQCPTIFSNKDLVTEMTPRFDFLTDKIVVQDSVMDRVTTDIFNKMNEMNFKLATQMSDHILEELMSELENTLSLLNATCKIQPQSLRNGETKEKEDDVKRNIEPHPKLSTTSLVQPSDELDLQIKSEKQRSRMHRGLRPQSLFQKEENQETVKQEVMKGNNKVELQKYVRKNSSDDLFLESNAPKLEHPGKDRPKRLKNQAATRPTVGPVHHGQEEDEDEGHGLRGFFDKRNAVKTQENNSGAVQTNAAKEKLTKAPMASSHVVNKPPPPPVPSTQKPVKVEGITSDDPKTTLEQIPQPSQRKSKDNLDVESSNKQKKSPPLNSAVDLTNNSDDSIVTDSHM